MTISTCGHAEAGALQRRDRRELVGDPAGRRRTAAGRAGSRRRAGPGRPAAPGRAAAGASRPARAGSAGAARAGGRATASKPGATAVGGRADSSCGLDSVRPVARTAGWASGAAGGAACGAGGAVRRRLRRWSLLAAAGEEQRRRTSGRRAAERRAQTAETCSSSATRNDEPQPQAATTFGLLTWKPGALQRVDVVDLRAVDVRQALGVDQERRPWSSKTTSPSRWSSKASWYWKPEQPPPRTPTRRPADADVGALGARNSRTFSAPFSVKWTPLALECDGRSGHRFTKDSDTLKAEMPTTDEIKRRIEAAIPDSTAEVEDWTGGGDHFRATVVSPAFAGLSRIAAAPARLRRLRRGDRRPDPRAVPHHPSPGAGMTRDQPHPRRDRRGDPRQPDASSS